MFGARSMMHWIIVGAIVLLLFGGRNKISNLMGDVAAGIKAFKKGMTEDDSAKPAIEQQPATASVERRTTV